MALVLGVMWRDNVRKYFVLDCLLFVVYFACWVVLLELMFQSSSNSMPISTTSVDALSLVVVGLNSLFLSKEIIQSGYCGRTTYFFSLWNWVDLSSILCIYIFVLATFVSDTGVEMIPLGVVTTLLLTIKFLSYLRGFSDTGWLVSVLIANFRDVRGFLLILFSILFGFAVTFRLLFGGTGEEAFDSLRRSFLSTFEITILGTYDASLLYDKVQFRALATVTFILAVTCVLVVALNALISILGDSYARVQEHSTANRRNERAALIVEYLTLLPSWYRERIEERTKWFHVLLEVDGDDNLLVKKDDWEGGLNAVRRDMKMMEQRLLEREHSVVDRVKNELDVEIKKFRRDVLAALTDVSEDLKRLHTLHSEGGITFSGKNVAKAVRAVKSIRRKGGAVLSGDS
jgi:Ion transport protein